MRPPPLGGGPVQHVKTIESLALTIDASDKTVHKLKTFYSKHSESNHDVPGVLSRQDLEKRQHGTPLRTDAVWFLP